MILMGAQLREKSPPRSRGRRLRLTRQPAAYVAECPGTWADDLTDDEIALVMDPEWRRRAALPKLGIFAVFMEQRLTAWGF